jgi:predicted amidohydrolase YtcJ
MRMRRNNEFKGNGMLKRGLGFVGAAACGWVMLAAWSTPALAQASGCEKLPGMLQERQNTVARLNANSKSKKKMSAPEACAVLGRLYNNGTSIISFMTANQDWCQIPEAFVTNMKEDNQRVVSIRSQACNAAKQQASMIRQQKQQQAQAQRRQQQGANSFSGADSVTGGAMRVPAAPL